jgi:hypothetical protein
VRLTIWRTRSPHLKKKKVSAPEKKSVRLTIWRTRSLHLQKKKSVRLKKKSQCVSPGKKGKNSGRAPHNWALPPKAVLRLC